MKDKTCVLPIFCLLLYSLLSFTSSFDFWFGLCTGKLVTMNRSYNVYLLLKLYANTYLLLYN